MITETEYRRIVAGSTLIRLPKSCCRLNHTTWCKLIKRVDMNSRVFGALAWDGKLFRAGQWVAEKDLYGDTARNPVVLETTQAEPLQRGCRVAGRGRWRELYILWQWNPDRGIWKELGRVEGSPLDSAPELRQLARRAIAQELFRETETIEGAADRIHAQLESEWSQMTSEQRRAVVAIVHSYLLTRITLEEEMAGFPSRVVARRSSHRRRSVGR